MRKAFIVMLVIMVFCFANCQHKEGQDFKKINFDWSENYIGQLAAGFSPNIEFKYWACIKTEVTADKSIFILYSRSLLSH